MVVVHFDWQYKQRFILWHAPDCQHLNFDYAVERRSVVEAEGRSMHVQGGSRDSITRVQAFDVKLDHYAQFWHAVAMSRTIPHVPVKPLRWIGPAKEELMEFPRPVMRAIGFALYEAQTGDKPDNAKPLRGFGGAGVLEVVEDHDGSTYRAVYTVQFGDAIYVLHCFQKKSTKGITTPKHVVELIERRLKVAIQTHAKRSN
jgi:phage-related protein